MAESGPVAWPPAPIRTERLVLRESEARDRAAFIELLASPEVHTYLGGPRPRDEDEGDAGTPPRRARRCSAGSPTVGRRAVVRRVFLGDAVWLSQGLSHSPAHLILWQDRGMLRLTDFIIDCPDTMKLAAFYSEVTGLPVKEDSNENWAGIQFGEIELAFIQVEDYRAPQWPDSEHPKQFHLDFEVDDIEAEQRRVLALGATLQRDCIGPDGYGFRVYADPIGHPFCLCRNKGVIWTDQGLS